MVGVAVRADDREHLTLPHRVEHRRRVAAGIDDDDLVVVTDDPGVGLLTGRGRHPVNPCAHPSGSFLVGLTRRPSYHSHPTAGAGSG